MHVPLAAKLAAKISSSNVKKYALLKYWISKKICYVNYTETHSKACVGVSSNPYEHTAFSIQIVVKVGFYLDVMEHTMMDIMGYK